jgi:serine/threonine-protein kinase HipA
VRRINIYKNGILAGILEEKENKYTFDYNAGYTGDNISFTMPLEQKTFTFEYFPAFFGNLLPEGLMLEGITKLNGINKNDFLSILSLTGKNLSGDIGAEECK